MIKSTFYKTALSIVLTASPLLAFSQTFKTPPESASSTRMLGLKTTHTVDASAVANNPALLTQLDFKEFLVSIQNLNVNIRYRSPTGVRDQTKNQASFAPNLYISSPVGEEKKHTVALGITVPQGLSVEWSKTGPFRYAAPYFSQLQLINLNPTFATKINDRLSFGIGGDVYLSDLKLNQYYPWALAAGAPVPDGVMRFEGDGYAVGWNAGLHLKLTEAQHLALTYRSSMEVDYEGDFTINNIPAGFPALPKTDFDTSLEFPGVVVLGYGADVKKNLSIGFDVEWMEYSTIDTISLDIGPNSPLLPSTAVVQDWDDIWKFGVGAEWTKDEFYTFSIGYAYWETPTQEQTYHPSLVGSDRHNVTLGGSYTPKKDHTFDFAWTGMFLDDQNISANDNPAFNGTYTFDVHIFSLSYKRDF